MNWVQGVELASTKEPCVPVAGHQRLDTELSADGILLASVECVASMTIMYVFIPGSSTMMSIYRWVSCSAYRIISRFRCPPSKVIRVARSVGSKVVLVHSTIKRVATEMARCRQHREHKVLANVKWCVNAR